MSLAIAPPTDTHLVPGTTGATVTVTPHEPGRVTVRVENRSDTGGMPAASLQLRAVSKVAGTTQLVVTGVAMRDRAGNPVAGNAPAPQAVNLVSQ